MKLKLFGIPIIETTEAKASAIAPMVAMSASGSDGGGVYQERNPEQYAREGYTRSAVVFRCVSMIARSAAAVPLKVQRHGKDMGPDHPLVRLLASPNPYQGGSAFMEALVAFLQLTGNTYAERVGPENGAPTELWTLRPDRMRVVPGRLGVAGYTCTVGGQMKRWDADPITGRSDIMHAKFFHPINDWYGLSPMEAAAMAVDAHNYAGKWNQSLLQNAGRPSGAIIYAPGETMPTSLTDKQRESLKEQVNASVAGAQNAGRILILDGGLDWRQISLSPADLDWLEGRRDAAREIALAYNVPPMLLGIPGDNTYSNQREARMAFHEDTVLPCLDLILDELNRWLAPAFGDGTRIVADTENLGALAPKREARWTAVSGASWLTINEKRAATGMGRIEAPEADTVLIPAGLLPLGEAFDDDAREGDREDDKKPEGGEAASGDAATAAAEAGSAQATALNGAQIASLLDVATRMRTGELDRDSARAVLAIAFPMVPTEQTAAMVDAIAKLPRIVPDGEGKAQPFAWIGKLADG